MNQKPAITIDAEVFKCMVELIRAIEANGTDGCGDLYWGFQGPVKKAKALLEKTTGAEWKAE